MYTLAFDTCFDACSAAVAEVRDGHARVLAERYEPMATGQAERLVPMIDEVLDEAGIAKSALTSIAVTIGPGTFTGTRIGIAAARALGLALKIPVVSLSSLHLMARRAGQYLCQDYDICVAIDVRRDELYVQQFNSTGLTARNEPQKLTINEAKCRYSTQNVMFTGNGGMLLGNGNPGLTALPDLLPHARYAFDLMGTPHSGGLVTPLYLRAPDAKPPSAAPLQRQ